MGKLRFVAERGLTDGPVPIARVSAQRCIRKMRGQCQSVLFQCSDSNFYIVKMSGNPQGESVLANEYIGSCVATSVGLPMPGIALVWVSSELINSNRGLWFQTNSDIVPPPAGLHFGSRLVGDLTGDGRASDYISKARIAQVVNKEDFLGMLLLDLWANHQDHRQAVFVSDPSSRELTAHFIDNGHMFGGPNRIYKHDRGESLFLYPDIYSGLFQRRRVEAWSNHLRNKIPSGLRFALEAVPPEWYSADREANYYFLLSRLDQLAELVKPYESRFGFAGHSLRK